MHRILVVNPGSTSTKLAMFEADRELASAKVEHDDDVLSMPVGQQLEPRLREVMGVVSDWVSEGLDAVVGRGGLLPPMEGGTYLVDDTMVDLLARAERGEHASNLGAAMARALAGDRPAYIVDPVSVDEMWPVARVTGLPGLERESLCHALNMRAVAYRHAAEVGRPITDLALVVAHMGGGVSLAAFHGGRMVDVVNPRDEGPMSSDRAGGLPSLKLARWVIDHGLTKGEVERRLFREGGFLAHLGLRDVREIKALADQGDARARLVLDAFTYQVSKAIGGLAAALSGEVDGVLLTGGMAHEGWLVEGIRARVGFVAPVTPYPGEDEMAALASGAQRVLSGEEEAKRFPVPARA